MVTETEALAVLPLDVVKAELRILVEDHDDLLTNQIVAAVSYVSRTTGIDHAQLQHIAALQQAAILMVRHLYDGMPELKVTSAIYAIIQPWRSYV